MEITGTNQMVDESFFEPALRLLQNYCRHRRDTPELSDEQFLRGCLLRVLAKTNFTSKRLGPTAPRPPTLKPILAR